MKNYSAKEIKNIVLIGAPGSGKTTLAEAMAYEGKVIDRRGAVETNNTLSDNTDIEHEYKRSIYSTILFTEFMEQRGPGHTVGSSKIYEKGLLDYQRDIQEAIDRLDFFQDPHALERKEELEGMYTACEALMILAARYSAYARELAEQESDTQRRRELLQIAANCEVVPAHRPQTYWQALQMYWFVHLAVTSELNPWDSYSPGRLDQHLFPFYERDVKAGILDDARALELLECLWIKFNNQPAPPRSASR